MDYFKIKYLRKDIVNMKYIIDFFNLLVKIIFFFRVRIWGKICIFMYISIMLRILIYFKIVRILLFSVNFRDFF